MRAKESWTMSRHSGLTLDRIGLHRSCPPSSILCSYNLRSTIRRDREGERQDRDDETNSWASWLSALLQLCMPIVLSQLELTTSCTKSSSSAKERGGGWSGGASSWGCIVEAWSTVGAIVVVGSSFLGFFFRRRGIGPGK